MPGNEVGDRIHNFFGQENSSQGQHHSQVVDGTWPGFSNNVWVGNQRQIGSPLISNLKNLNVPQTALADAERGQSSSLQHGMNYTQSALRSEFFRSQPQVHQLAVNGYTQGNQVQTRQNEANLLGVDTEPDRHSLASRSMSVIDHNLGNGPDVHKKNLMRLESTDSPVNYDFFGGPQQIIGQHSVLQSLPRQAPGISDMLLHQQIMLKQMQEFQRQQQLQRHQLPQQEARQTNSINQIVSMPRQTTGNPSAGLINGIPVHDTANYSWQPELVVANANWLQRGASPVVQGSSSGLVFTPEQGQVRLMGLVPQQFEQSLYGVPVSSTRGIPSQYPSVQMEKAAMLQLSGGNNSFPAEHYPAFSDQVSLQGSALLSRQGSLGKNSFGPAAVGGSNDGLGSENFQQFSPQQRSTSVQEFNSRQDVVLPSEASEEKTSTQVTPSQNLATLDPTEERILFGSDDNLWDAFGRGSNMSNMLDGSDILGAFPSVQSGSWSALMQSAVAETSSGDIGPPEEWNGLNVQNTTAPGGNQLTSMFLNGSKQQSAWSDYNLQSGSTMNNSRAFSPADNATATVNYCNVPTASQSGTKVSNEQSVRLQLDPSQRLPQQFPDEASKWLDHNSLQKQVAEGSQLHANISHSSSAELSAKGVSWSNQQGVSAYGSGAEAGTRLNGWNFFESAASGGGATLQNLGNDRSLQSSQGGEYNTSMLEGMGQVAGIRMTDSLSNATVEIAHFRSTIGSRVNDRGVSDLNNAAALTVSSNVRANHETSQQLLNNNNLNFFKNVDTSASSKGSGLPGTYQQQLGRSPKKFQSLGHNDLDKGVVDAHEMENSMKENSEGFLPNASQHASTIGHLENVWVDANDSRTLPGRKQMSSSHVGREPSIARKFQYHPMGDLDYEEEPPYGTKQSAHSHSPSQQQASRCDQGYFGKPKSLTHMARNSVEIEKGHLSALQGDSKCMDEVPSKNLHPGYMPSASASFDRSVSNYGPDKTAPLSQNMLELLNKVDRSRELGAPTHLSSSDCNRSSEMPDAETSEGSVGHLQQNQSSGSQGFCLQLGPPSQRLSIPDHTLSSQNFSQAVNSLASTHVTSDTAGQSHSWLAPMSSTQSLHSSHEPSEGTFINSLPSISGKTSDSTSLSKMQGNSSASFSAFSYTRNHLQSQHVIAPGGETSSTQPVNLPFDRLAPQTRQIDDSGGRTKKSQLECVSLPEMSKCELVSSADTSRPNTSTTNHLSEPLQRFPVLEAMPASQPSVSSNTSQQQGVFSKVSPNARSNISNLQHLIGAQLCKPYSNLLIPQSQSNSNLETSFSDQQKLDQNSQKGVEDSSEVGASLAKSQGLDEKEQPAKEQQLLPEKNASCRSAVNVLYTQGKEPYVDHSSDTLSSIPTTSQRDIEAFGRSLRPNNTLNDNFSLLHQVLAMRSAEIDPGNRSLKRFKGQEDSMDSQQVASRGQLLSSPNHTSVAPGDSKMLAFPSKIRDENDTDMSARDMVGDSQSQSSNTTAAAVRGDQSYISPHMAPSWFGHYGTFKNGQMLPIYDSQKRASNSLHVRHPMERVHTSDTSQLGDIRQITSSSSFSSPQLPQTNQNLAIVRPKKRKSNTFELVSWSKELTQGSPRLQNISVAEVGWCQAVNRRAEKLEDEAEVIEDGSPLLRSKRRLILTTQLMQQLFHPPPAAVLSLEASLHYETLVYFIARAALGDGCRTLSSSGSDNSVLPDSGNLLFEKTKIFEKIDDPFILKTMENFIGRAKKLENDLLRLDKRASILDLRVEWQELEKFSVINRFAKFHGRGQTDGVETSSSYTTANTQKSSPQRYVTAFPMPRNLPDRVQCLSL